VERDQQILRGPPSAGKLGHQDGMAGKARVVGDGAFPGLAPVPAGLSEEVAGGVGVVGGLDMHADHEKSKMNCRKKIY